MNSKNKLFKFAGVLTVLAILIFHTAFMYREYISKEANAPNEVLQLGGMDHNTGEITKLNGVKQTFEVANITFSGIGLSFGTYGRTNTNHLDVKLKERQTEKILGEWQVDCQTLVDNKFIELPLKERITITEKENLQLTITTKDGVAGNTVAASSSLKNNFKNTQLSVNEKNQKGELRLSLLEGSQGFLKTYFVGIAIVLFLMLGLVWWFGIVRKCRLERLFLIMGTCLGLLYIFILPPYTTPDEMSHINTAYYYSSTLLGEEALKQDGKVLLRPGDFILSEQDNDPTPNTYKKVTDHLFEKYHEYGSTGRTTKPLSGVPWFVYVPQILGITLCRLLNLGNVAMLMTGRLFALAFYLMWGYFAVKKMPFAKAAIFTIFLLPIALELGASYSYDSIIIGTSLFFIAYCFHLAYEKKKVSKKDFVLLGIVAVLLAPCKIVYLLLCFLVFLIPKEKVESKKVYWIGIAGVLAVGILSVAAVRITTMVMYISRQENTLSYAAQAGYTVSELLTMPMAVIRLLYNTFWSLGDFYFVTMMGGSLGWLNIGVSGIWITTLFVILLLSVQTVAKEKILFTIGKKALIGSVIIGVVGALMAVFLLTWTPVGSKEIQGVQGRYFLPVLPLALLVFRNKLIVLKENIDTKLVLALGITQFFIVWEVFQKVIQS